MPRPPAPWLAFGLADWLADWLVDWLAAPVIAALTIAALLTACSAEPPALAPPWTGTFDEPVARPEHPRPDLRRDTFINLNTRWQFAFDPGDVGVDERWFERDDVWTDAIQLPYAWEAPLSGLGERPDAYSPAHTADATTYRGVAWYRLPLPGALAPGDDWYLVFGAVDFHATVWIDGVEAGEHRGGYTPFSVRVGVPEQPPVIVVRVEDVTDRDDRSQPVGKQGGTWYTRVSGIWQTVYLERRPAVHLTGLRLVPDAAAGELVVRPAFDGVADIHAAAWLDGQSVGEVSAAGVDGAAAELRLPLTVVEPWSPASPTLYDLDVTLNGDGGEDVVHSYFGLSAPAVGWLPGRSPDDTDDPHQQAASFLAHGEPIYPRCVLDQSYWPDGLYTAPSLDAIRGDLELARDHGFNCIRLHIKPDEPVKLRLLDELGFHLVYDLPSLDMQAENVEGFAGRAHFEQTLREVVARDASHPSLLSWVVFNENWGLSANGSLIAPTPLADDPGMQAWVAEMVALTRALDPAHPVEDNSAGGIVGAFEHLDTDVNSFHHYEADAADWRAMLDEQDALTYPGSPANYVGGALQDGAPWWNSEFASFSFVGSPEDAFCDLFGALNELRRQPRLVGWTLTQLTDVEFEHNGLVSYDRGAKDDLCAREGVALQDLFGDDFVGFDWLPGERLEVSESVAVPVWFAAWSSPAPRPLTLSLRWAGGEPTTVAFTTTPYDVAPIPGATIDTPLDPGEYTLVAEVLDGDEARVCANRLTVVVE